MSILCKFSFFLGIVATQLVVLFIFWQFAMKPTSQQDDETSQRRNRVRPEYEWMIVSSEDAQKRLDAFIERVQFETNFPTNRGHYPRFESEQRRQYWKFNSILVSQELISSSSASPPSSASSHSHSNDLLWIFVHCESTSLALRELIRASWGRRQSHAARSIRTVFLIQEDKEESVLELVEEQRLHGDLIVADASPETYWLIVFYISLYASTPPNRLVLVEENYFIDIFHLVNFLLLQSKQLSDSSDWIACIPSKNLHNPYFSELFPYENYPEHCVRGVIVLSRSAALRLLAMSEYTSIFSPHYVYVTGMLPYRCNINLTTLQVPNAATRFGLELLREARIQNAIFIEFKSEQDYLRFGPLLWSLAKEFQHVHHWLLQL